MEIAEEHVRVTPDNRLGLLVRRSHVEVHRIRVLDTFADQQVQAERRLSGPSVPDQDKEPGPVFVERLQHVQLPFVYAR